MFSMSMKPESIEKKKQASRCYINIIFNKIQKGHVKSHWAHQDLKRTFHPSPKSHPKALLAVGRWSASVPLGYMRAGAILPAAGGKNKNRHHITSCTNDVGTFSTQSILLHFTPPQIQGGFKTMVSKPWHPSPPPREKLISSQKDTHQTHPFCHRINRPEQRKL